MRPMLGVPLIHACAAAWIMCMPVPLRCDLDSRVRLPPPPPPPPPPLPRTPHGMDSGAPNAAPGSSSTKAILAVAVFRTIKPHSHCSVK